MAQDITGVQRDLADLQKQAKQLSDKIKNESDPNRKAILQKKLIDLNTKKAKLNKEMEDLVTSIGVGQELEFAEGFTKWNKYKKSKVKKLTEAEKLKIKNFAKGLVESNSPAANAHPWVIRRMQELKEDLEFYLSPKPNTKIDFGLLKSKLNDLVKTINKYHK